MLLLLSLCTTLTRYLLSLTPRSLAAHLSDLRKKKASSGRRGGGGAEEKDQSITVDMVHGTISAAVAGQSEARLNSSSDYYYFPGGGGRAGGGQRLSK